MERRAAHTPAHGRQAICSRLSNAGLRPTRQRVALARLLFCRGNHHLTAEILHAEAQAERTHVSLATIYNTLNQFTECGLLRHIVVSGMKTFYDPDTSEHAHFFFEDDEIILDVPAGNTAVGRLPNPPPGYEIERVDVVVRLRRSPN